MPSRRRIVQFLLIALMVGVLVQFLTAGLGIIGGYRMKWHAMLGWFLVLLALISFVVVALSRPGRATTFAMLTAAALIILQPVLILAVRRRAPVIAAFHAVDGVLALILLLAISDSCLELSRFRRRLAWNSDERVTAGDVKQSP